jgi:hypothetical protein
MRSASLLVLLVLALVGCDSAEKESPSPAADPRAELLVGTWRLGTEREYVFRADGSFSMALDHSKCGGAAPATSTVSGRWQLDANALVLDVTQASEEIFRGSTMRDTIVELQSAKLTLNSSVVSCNGQDIELHKD